MQEHPLYAEVLTHYLALLTILGAAFVVAFALFLMYVVYKKDIQKYSVCLSRYIFPIGFFVALGGVFLSLFYSEVLHYVPCDLCWYQRIFLYPQVFLFGLAWYKKDRAILPYVLLLSIVGFVIAGYHHLLQIGYNVYKPCSSAPFAVDCSKPSFIEFGFVTFPFMAVVLFGFLSLLIYTSLQTREK